MTSRALSFAPLCASFLLAAFAVVACGSDEGGGPVDAATDSVADSVADAAPDSVADTQSDAGPDAAPDAIPDAPDAPDVGLDTATDAGRDTGGDTDADASSVLTVVEEGVDLDLAPYLPPPSEGYAAAFPATDASHLLPGESAAGYLGDWIIENDRARFVVQRSIRATGPCPWGGTVIDAGVRRADGTWTEDTLGEICPFVHLAQTFSAERYQIIDQNVGGAAVLAVSGHMELLDFIDVQGSIESFLSGATLTLPFDTDALLPIRMTIFYILAPDSSELQVVTAVRNDSDDTIHTILAHVVFWGGNVEPFNPLGSRKGFGYPDGAAQIGGDLLGLLAAYSDQTSWAVYLDSIEGLHDTWPVGGSAVTISGVSVAISGVAKPLEALLLPPDEVADAPQLVHLPAGATVAQRHVLAAAEGSVAPLLAAYFEHVEWDVGTVSGVILDEADQPLAGARVTFVDAGGRAWNQDVTADDGTFSAALPPGEYTASARTPGRLGVHSPTVTVAAGAQEYVELTLPAPATLQVTIRTPEGDSTSGRVTVRCKGACPNAPTAAEADVNFDQPPADVAEYRFVGPEGEAEILLHPGEYEIFVSCGIEWSVWPSSDLAEGYSVTLVSGETTNVASEIAHVVDSTGWMSGDFHVHSINSPDARAPGEQRVRSFLGEGVDVLVSTDHDYVVDFAPVIEALGVQDEIVSISGVELTTATYGHYNAFPLEVQLDSPNGGAPDWAGGAGPNLVPADVFALLHAAEGEQVVQVNHPAGGMIANLRAVPLTGQTFANPEDHRMAPLPVDPETGDTGLWSDDFTAIELYNGHGLDEFWEISRWWFQMLGRGFSPTGTAVTDTHKLYSSLGGSPRTFVRVSEEHDTPATFDPEAFVAAINEGRAVGSAGPFLTAALTDSEGTQASFGDTIATTDDPLTLTVHVQAPTWMSFDRIDVYMNVTEDLVYPPGKSSDAEIPPTYSLPVSLDPEVDRTTVATGTVAHHRWSKTVEFPISTDVDAWLVVVVRGINAPSMSPILRSGNARPFAFANPIFIDADGNGFDHPPMMQAAEDAAATPFPTPPKPAPRQPTRDELHRWLHKGGHQHRH